MTHVLAGRPSGATATDLAREHPAVVRFGKVGWFAKGVVYVLAGSLAMTVVARSYGWRTPTAASVGEASPTGALVEVAEFTRGRVLLAVLGVGLALYALWRVATAVLPGRRLDAEAIVVRAGYLVSAVLYGTWSFTSISLARHPGQRVDGNRTVTVIGARLLDAPAGRVALAAGGVIAVLAALYRALKGLRGDVTDELDLAGMSALRRSVVRQVGRVGEVGRSVAIGLIGIFLVRSATDGDADQATGLDGALRRLARVGWGRAVVAVVAVGFLLYGVLCLLTFTRRRLRTP